MLVLALFFIACCGELFLNGVCAVFDVPALEPGTVIHMEMPDGALGVRGNPAFPGHDRNGFRNPAVPSSADIVVLGDSQSYGVNAEAEYSWPRILEKKINKRVYNMSFGGYSAVNHRLLFEEALSFHPRIIIEALYTGNDFGEAYIFVYPQDKFPQLRLTDPVMLGQIDAIERRELFTDKIAVLFRQPAFEEKRMSPLTRFFQRRSKLYLMIRAVKWELERKFRGKVNPWDEEKKRALNGPEDFQVFEKAPVRTVFCSRARLAVLDGDDPRIREGMRLCIEAVRWMDRRCKEREIQFVVVGIPTKEFVFKDKALDIMGNVRSYHDLIENEKIAWSKIREFCSREGIVFIDCLPGLQSAISPLSQPYSEDSNGHPDADGYEAIAASVASILKTL